MSKPKVKLPKVFRRRWLAMLRSGNYEQTTGTNQRIGLNNRHSYCCLGVACRAAGVPAKVISGASLSDFAHNKTNGVGFQLVQRAVLAKGFAGDDGLQHQLIVMNDTYRWSFKRIAAYIEKRTVGV